MKSPSIDWCRFVRATRGGGGRGGGYASVFAHFQGGVPSKRSSIVLTPPLLLHRCRQRKLHAGMAGRPLKINFLFSGPLTSLVASVNGWELAAQHVWTATTQAREVPSKAAVAHELIDLTFI